MTSVNVETMPSRNFLPDFGAPNPNSTFEIQGNHVNDQNSCATCLSCWAAGYWTRRLLRIAIVTIGLAVLFILLAIQNIFSNSTYTDNNDVASNSKTMISSASLVRGDDMGLPIVSDFNDGKDLCTTLVCKEVEVEELIQSLNKSVDPCDNFYEFACQGWQNNNPRPSYTSDWNVITKLTEKSANIVKAILEDSKKIGYYDYQTTPPALNQAKEFYRKCLEVGNDKYKNDTLQKTWDILEDYGGWPILYENGTWSNSTFDWMRTLVDLRRRFDSVDILDIQSYHNQLWNDTMIVISPPSYVIPSEKKELETPQQNDENIGESNEVAYTSLMVSLSKALLAFKGQTNIDEDYLNISAYTMLYVQSEIISIKFNEVSQSFKDAFGINSTYLEATVGKIQNILDAYTYPVLNKLYLKKLLDVQYAHTSVQITGEDIIHVNDFDYLLQISEFLTFVKTEALANFLNSRIVFKIAELASGKMHDFINEFRKTVLGTEMETSRNSVCSSMTQEKFQVALNYAYIKMRYPGEHDSANDFAEILEMFQNIRQSFLELLFYSNNPYLNITHLRNRIAFTGICRGYPSWIYNVDRVQAEYAGLALNQSTFLEQSMAFNAWSVDKNLNRLRQKQDNSEECNWDSFVGAVDPFNRPDNYLTSGLLTEGVYLEIYGICIFVDIPVGILQPPFFSVESLRVLNYARFGTVLGHELSHSLNGWSEFNNGSLIPSAKCYVHQYSNYSIDELRRQNDTVDGGLTLIENIADNVGLIGAYTAFKRKQSGNRKGFYEESKKPKGLEEYSNDQLFFIGFAQNWCQSTTIENLHQTMKTDTHSPPMFRVLGSLINSKEFAKAWSCPAGSRMNPGPSEYEKCSML